jgi:hypothetical protein
VPTGYMTDTGRIAGVVNYWYANASAPAGPTAPFHLRLMTTVAAGNGNVSGTNGTEMATANGYTSGNNVTNSLGSSPTFSTFSATSPAAIVNQQSVTWAATGTWSLPIPGVEIWDTSATPVRFMQGAVTSSITGVVNGDSVQFAAGAISASPVQW